MIVWYESYNTHPKAPGIIGLCTTDYQYREYRTDWCCEMAEENIFTDVKGYMGYPPKGGAWMKEDIRNMSFGESFENIINNKIPSKGILTKCPYCGEEIVYKNIREQPKHETEELIYQ